MIRTDRSQRAVVVAGSGRSGTTWICNVLAACQRSISVFEPLHANRVPGVPVVHPEDEFPGTYLRPWESHPDWERFFAELLTGRVSNSWTRQDWQRVPRLFGRAAFPDRLGFRLARLHYEVGSYGAKMRVIKVIRGNLLLGWMCRNLPFDLVFIVRHPCAVVASRLRHGWPYSLDGVWRQSHLVDDHLQPFRQPIADAKGPLQRMAVLWCIENLVALSTLPENRAMVQCYESFQADPYHSLAILRHRLRLGTSTRYEIAMRRWASNPCRESRSPERQWHAGLGRDDGERVLDICREFGMDLYSRDLGPADFGRFRISCPMHAMEER